MKALQRTQLGNPVLRMKARAIPASFLKTKTFKQLVSRMFQTMHRAHGVGLAAPQVGLPVRIAVISVRPERAGGKTRKVLRRVIVNPKILWHSAAKENDWEGCLSFPGARGEVPRWSAVRVAFTNEEGERVTEAHRGFAARVFQHEIDHLDGIVYVDRMKDMRTLMTYREFLARIVKPK